MFPFLSPVLRANLELSEMTRDTQFIIGGTRVWSWLHQCEGPVPFHCLEKVLDNLGQKQGLPELL